MQMGRQLFTNLIWRSNAHTAVRKTSSERQKTKQNNNNNNNNKKQKTKQKWGTGAVQDKPFDELLMFIVDKD